jgi:hypothetical protein
MGQGQSCMKYSDHHMKIGDHVGYALTHVHKIPQEHQHHFIHAGYDTERAKKDLEHHYSGGGVRRRLSVPSCVQKGCRQRALQGHSITGFFGQPISQKKMNKHYSHYTDQHAVHNLVHHQIHGQMAYKPQRVNTHTFAPHSSSAHIHPNHQGKPHPHPPSWDHFLDGHTKDWTPHFQVPHNNHTAAFGKNHHPNRPHIYQGEKNGWVYSHQTKQYHRWGGVI